MPLVQHDDMIQALAPNRSDHPFDEWTLPGRAVRGDDLLDAYVLDSLPKLTAVDGIAIPYEESRCLFPREGLDNLLSRPFCCRVRSDVEVRNSATLVAENKKRVEDAKCRCGNSEEVDSHNVANVIGQEGPPPLRGWLGMPDSVEVDGGISHVVAEQRQLGLDARRSPKGILARHAPDQLAYLGINLRATGFPGSRLPSPVELEALFVPSNHCLWLDDQKRRLPFRPEKG